MICPGCGSANADDVLVCVTCGEDLSSNFERVPDRVCHECRFENNTDASFCMNCGAALSTSTGSRPGARQQSRRKHEPALKSRHHTYRRKSRYESPATLIAVALGVVVVSVLYGTRQHRSEASASTAPPGVILNPAMKPGFDTVADRFFCGCGRCTEPLWQCNCPTAENEKNMVKNDLEGGEKLPKIIDAVYENYRHLAGGSGAKETSAAGARFNPGSLKLPE